LKRAILALVFLSLLVSTTSAQLSQQNQAILAARYRQSMGLEETVAQIKAGEIDAKRLAILRAILSATPEVQIHRLQGATGNEVFLHPEGHQEAVYGPHGQLVSDGINDGSYNYFHPTTDPARHFFFDIHPWILMGNSRHDPTTPKERVTSYVSDLEFGIVQAAKSRDFPPVDARKLTDGELETYAILIKALEAEDANDLFAAVESQQILNDESRAALLRKIEKSFQKLYAE
jgi:hypothetical protein